MIRVWALGIALLLVGTALRAQEIANVNPVIKFVAGVPFYVHEVLPGQSLDAIAKAYASSAVAIKAANPSLSDTLVARVKIHIPFTDASADVMAAKSTSENAVEHKQKRSKKRASDSRALDEAAALLPAPKQALTANEQALLQELSSTLSEGLDQLRSAENRIEETPFIADDGLPKNTPIAKTSRERIKPKGASLIQLLDDFAKAFLYEDSTLTGAMHMREYFLVRVNPEGVISNVRDERTLTNHNTLLLNVDDLVGRNVTDSADAFNKQIVPLGLNLHLEKHFYLVKVKKGKVKPLKPKEMEQEDLAMRSEHVELVQTDEAMPTRKGKFVVTVAQGEYFISIHDQFEYNPFGVTIDEVDRRTVLRVIQWSQP
jgi:uncharacterized membrane protein